MEPAISPPPGRKRDALVVATSSAVLLTSAVLGQLSRLGIWILPARSICWSQLLLHRACPGCGLSRSFVAIGSGDLWRGLAMNPLGPVLFGLIALALVVHGVRSLTGVPREVHRIDWGLAGAAVVAMVVRTIAFYL